MRQRSISCSQLGCPRPENISIAVGASRAEVTVRAQQLIEQRAAGVPVVGGTGARGGREEFDTVADPHLLDQTALDGHDDRDVGQRLLPALQSDPALSTPP
jgi:hypothetical protein